MDLNATRSQVQLRVLVCVLALLPPLCAYFDSLPKQYVVFGLAWVVVLIGLGSVRSEGHAYGTGGSGFVD